MQREGYVIMSEYKLKKEEDVKAKITNRLEEFCGGCLKRKNEDCDFAELPEAIEKCRYVEAWFTMEMNG